MKIIVGLGNPETKYNNTRHNAGFMVLDALAKELGLKWEMNKKFNSLTIKHEGMILAKPQTYMNNSGEAVQALLHFYKINPLSEDLPEILTVVHDDLDIGLGEFRISADSRSAGHNGAESIIERLGTKNFKRIRIGIKTGMSGRIPAEKFVLEKFKPEELEIINKLIPEIIKKIKTT